MSKIGSGIFMWNGVERRSDRYGFVFLADSNYEGNAHVDVMFDEAAVDPLIGKKVKLSAVVIESRPSGHVGDFALGIFPSQPEVGERVELGVGMFCACPNEYSADESQRLIGLKPVDGRKVFWMDPRTLFHLHDQTVELFAEETEEPFSPAPDLAMPQDGMIAVGDGAIQVKHCGQVGEVTKAKVSPEITPLGDGLFIMEHPSMKPGEIVQGSFEVK